MSINAIIAQFAPGFVSPFSGQGASPFSSPPESSSIAGPDFVRRQATAGMGQDQPRLVYTRKDVTAPRREGEPAAEASGPADTGGAAAGAANDAVGGDSESPVPADSLKKPNGESLSKAEMAVLRELQKADQAVRAHEMAHLAAAGGYATGGASFSYQRGPDGQSYAVGGEVQIDTGKEATPEATIVKMQVVRQAALAPADPSPQDQRVASYATLQIAEASKELFTSRASRDQLQPLVQQPSEAEGETARDIYRGAGQEMERGGHGPGLPAVKQAVSAYRSFVPPSAERGSSPIDFIA